MDGKRTVIPNKRMSPYQLTSVEAVNVGSVNRVLEHLLKNDDLLKAKLDEAGFTGTILSWSRSGSYNPGDLVCYMSYKTEPPIAYLLVCVKPTHVEPVSVVTHDLKDLEDCGWKLIHESMLYLTDQDLLISDVLDPAVAAVVADHEASEWYHNGIRIESIDDFSKTFLKNDLSNFRSKDLLKDDGTKTGATAEGSRLGTSFSPSFRSYTAHVSDGVTELEISFGFDEKANQDIEILNPRYFLQDNPVKDKSDAHIFGSYYAEETKDVTLNNGLTYRNIRIPGTNVFSAVIEFPEPFKDTSYTVFQSSYLPNQFIFTQSASELVSRKQPICPVFVGNIMFTNKTPSSITAILPLHTHFSQYGQYVVGVPWINEFKITVAGVTNR